MAITLIVEDGSIVTDANTFASVATVREYAELRGVTLPTGDDAVAVQIIKGMDYILTFSARFKGQLVDEAQPLPFPRDYVRFHGYTEFFPNDEIPPQLIAALGQLCIEQTNGVELLSTSIPGLPVVREKVDVIETEYANPVSLGGLDYTQARMPLVDALLKSLLNSGFSLTTVRV